MAPNGSQWLPPRELTPQPLTQAVQSVMLFSKAEAMKEEERRQQIEREKAELEEAKRTAARVAEVSILVAAIIPSIRAALSTCREKNLENVVTKIRARLGSEANKSAELALAASVLEEMKLRSRATEGEVLAMIKAAVETGVSIHNKKTLSRVITLTMHSMMQSLHLKVTLMHQSRKRSPRWGGATSL